MTTIAEATVLKSKRKRKHRSAQERAMFLRKSFVRNDLGKSRATKMQKSCWRV